MTKKFLIALLMLVLSITMVAGVAAQDDPGTIVDELANIEGLSTLAGAAGLADPAAIEALQGEGPFTLFAPVDDAFAVMDPEAQSAALADPELLTNVLRYHIVPGLFTAEDVTAALEESEDGTVELPTLLEGETIVVSTDDDGNVTVNGVVVTGTDFTASNGVIHTLGEVLLPEVLFRPQSYVMEPEEGALGSEDDPVVLLFIPSENAETVLAGAEELAALITEKTGLAIEARVSTDYSAAIEAICGGEAEIAALNTFGYVLASERGCAEVGVVSTRFGSAFYNGQIMVRADSGITDYSGLNGVTFCRPDPLSTSGWIIPSIDMQANGVDVEGLEVIDTGGHDGVVTAMYNGDCVAGASFVDARNNVADEYEDILDQVLVLTVSPNIPNDTLSFSSEVPDDIQLNIVAALLEIADDEESLELLDAVYGWGGLQQAEDAFFDDFREQLDAAGVDIEELN